MWGRWRGRVIYGGGGHVWAGEQILCWGEVLSLGGWVWITHTPPPPASASHSSWCADRHTHTHTKPRTWAWPPDECREREERHWKKLWTWAVCLEVGRAEPWLPPPRLVSRRWPHRHTAIRIWNAKHKVTEKDRCHLIHYRLLNTSSKHQSAGQRAPTAPEGRWDWCGCWWQQWWQSREAWLRCTHATMRPPIFLFKTSQPQYLGLRVLSDRLKKTQKERTSTLKLKNFNFLQESKSASLPQCIYHTTMDGVQVWPFLSYTF